MNENRVKRERFHPILESPFSSLFDLLRPSVLKAALSAALAFLGGRLGQALYGPAADHGILVSVEVPGMSQFQCVAALTFNQSWNALSSPRP